MPNPPLLEPHKVGRVSATRIVKVIEIDTVAGTGVDGEPWRRIVQWWTLDGTLLAERDPWLEAQQREAR